MSRGVVYALHGFLGQTSDWSRFSTNLCPIDLYSKNYTDVKRGMEAWAKSFNEQINPDDFNILMGYSMGGRLALHCLQDRPDLWQGAVFLSTHPGLTGEEEKRNRYQGDLLWAQNFKGESWETLMQKWNGQSVFGGSNLIRKEENYCREKLGDTLKYWSLAKQSDFRSMLSSIEIPVLWAVGERDEKFKTLSNDLVFKNQKSKKAIIKNGSHRLIELYELCDSVAGFLRGL